MQQVKIFVSIENEVMALEKEINQWLAQSGAKVISITGNIAPQTPKGSDTMGSAFGSSDVFIILLYET